MTATRAPVDPVRAVIDLSVVPTAEIERAVVAAVEILTDRD